MVKPPIDATLTWQGGLRFAAAAGSQRLILDSEGEAGPSPMQTLALALASCLSIDIVLILEKGRHPLTGLEVEVRGLRAEEPPRRFTAVEIAVHVSGDVPAAAVERAVALSREKYCSVWHSMRQDIDLVLRSSVGA